jgi:hypothetical protein
MDHRPYRCFFDSNRSHHTGQCTEPVGGVDHLRARDAREEILSPTRKPDHLMRERRPHDQDVIIFQRGFVDADVHFVRQGWMPVIACDLFDLVLLHHAQRGQRGRRVPGMVHQADVFEVGRPFFCRDANQFIETFFGQRWVSSQRDHEIQLVCVVQHVHQGSE